MSRNRRSKSLNHYLSIVFAVAVGIFIGTAIGFYNYTLIRSCLNGNMGACLVLHRR